MAIDQNPGTGQFAPKPFSKDPKKKKKDDKKEEDLSDEDLALKQQLELNAERVHDLDPGIQKMALESMSEATKELEEVVDGAEITPADLSEVLIKNRRYKKERAVGELLEVLKGRVEAKKKNGDEERRSEIGEGTEEEEQEKRALDSPKEEDEGFDKCNGNGEGPVEKH